MKSIRLSLVVYFLVLLAVALFAVSAFADRATRASLEKEKAVARELLEARQKERHNALTDQLDQALLAQARTLANEFRSQSRNQWQRIRLQILGLLTVGHNPNGWLMVPQWVAQGAPTRLYFALSHLAAPEIHFVEELLPLMADGGPTEYFQINSFNSEGGSTVWRSRSLGEHTLPFDAKAFAGHQAYDWMYDWRFDDVEVAPGHTVRRVILKLPYGYRPRPSGGASSRRSQTASDEAPKPPPGRVPPPPDRRPDNRSPVTYYQYACDTTQRDAALAALQTELDGLMLQQEEESEAILAALRDRLLWISLATFAACVVGGFWFVHHGLSPLRRLSDAVSRVSEKDFRLQFDETELPRELRPISQRLTQTLELLHRAFAREKQAAADISHELRTPLAALLTTTEVALRKPREPEEYRELLQDCRTTCQEMSRLVERLLALARLDAGVDTLRWQEVDVAGLAEQCAALVRPLAEARGLRLQVHRNGPACLTVDADKLREVLNNLLHNAIEYNRPDGSVEVAVERQNGRLQIEVRDTGIGITPEARRHIFERFYRADPARQADDLHAGLGLAIVKGYVDLMGGTIAVDSTGGQGSTFCVRLPVRAAAGSGQ
jgi:heavy metal sensor kinase